MQKKIKVAVCQYITVLVTLFVMTMGHAGNPLWTFTPDPYYPSTVSVTSASSAIIKYTVTNQSHKTHTLVMKPIPGITQNTTGGNCSTSFTLKYLKSCTLELLVDGSRLSASIRGGPVVCESGNPNQCYQPSLANSLNITLAPLAKYVITPTAAANGSITPNAPKTVVSGSSIPFTATPSMGYQVDQWLVDGGLVQKGGSQFTLLNVDANHTVDVTFTQKGALYAGLANGSVYFSTDNGLSWNFTTIPSVGNGVTSVFATETTLYAGSTDGKVYSSESNGVFWSASSAIPGGASVSSVFVTKIATTTTLYCGASDGAVYYSIDHGTTWTATTNPGSGAVNSLFVTPTNVLYAGSDDGSIYYSLNQGANWNQINGPGASVQNVFVTSDSLYVNTRKISSNSTLPAGTVDFEYVYSSNSLTATNPVWTLLSQITYTLFVNADASVIYAGTQDGYVFSLTTGDELGFITYSPINSLFFLG